MDKPDIKFVCPRCGPVVPRVVYYTFPMQANCPNCKTLLETGEKLKMMSEEEARRIRPSFYEKKS